MQPPVQTMRVDKWYLEDFSPNFWNLFLNPNHTNRTIEWFLILGEDKMTPIVMQLNTRPNNAHTPAPIAPISAELCIFIANFKFGFKEL